MSMGGFVLLIYRYYAISYKGLEQPRIVEFPEVLEPTPLDTEGLVSSYHQNYDCMVHIVLVIAC